jgi:hypothetical protein
MGAGLTRLQIETLPHYRRKTQKEYSAACPVCGGKDRFLYWPETGNYWCRQCDLKGFVEDGPRSWSAADREQFMRMVAERAEQERAARKAALDIMASKADRAAYYHHTMPDRSYWYSQGLTDATIDKYQLGWCPRCPTYPQSSSWTIPVTFRGKLLNIRHRLANPPTPGDKYRPEMGGVGNAIFNADLFDQHEQHPVLMVVEGEVKSMVLTQNGFPAVGIPGAASFKPAWARWFEPFTEVIVCLDPGADKQAQRVAAIIGGRARIVVLPVKPDDFFVLYGRTRETFQHWLRYGVPVGS